MDSSGMKLHCTVIKAETNRELCGYRVVTRLCSIAAQFLISHWERTGSALLTGSIQWLTCPLQAKDIDTNTKYGFEEMDKALKAKWNKTESKSIKYNNKRK
jgi:hypothetical protein